MSLTQLWIKIHISRNQMVKTQPQRQEMVERGKMRPCFLVLCVRLSVHGKQACTRGAAHLRSMLSSSALIAYHEDKGGEHHQEESERTPKNQISPRSEGKNTNVSARKLEEKRAKF